MPGPWFIPSAEKVISDCVFNLSLLKPNYYVRTISYYYIIQALAVQDHTS